MKKKITSMMALGLSLAMVLGTTVSASSIATGDLKEDTDVTDTAVTVDGDNATVVAPVYSMVLPTTAGLTATIDKMQLSSDDQISTGVVGVQNKSNIPVNVVCKIKNTASGVNYEASADKVNQTDTTVAAKDAYMGVYFATAVTGAAAEAKATMAAEPEFAVTDAETEFTLALQESKYESATYTDYNSYSQAAFQVKGAVNPYAEWAAEDVKLSATFTVTGFAKQIYKDTVGMTGTTTVAHYLNNELGLIKVPTTLDANSSLEVAIDYDTAKKTYTSTAANTVLFNSVVGLKPTKVLYEKGATAGEVADVTATSTGTIVATYDYGKATVTAANWAAVAKTLCGSTAPVTGTPTKLYIEIAVLDANGIGTSYPVEITITAK